MAGSGGRPEKEIIENLKRLLPEMTRQVRAEFEKRDAALKKDSRPGLIGRLIGDQTMAPYSIGLIVTVLSFGTLIVLMVRSTSPDLEARVVEGMLALPMTAAGYLLGYQTSRRR